MFDYNVRYIVSTLNKQTVLPILIIEEKFEPKITLYEVSSIVSSRSKSISGKYVNKQAVFIWD